MDMGHAVVLVAAVAAVVAEKAAAKFDDEGG
jgi:hypothetical protein